MDTLASLDEEDWKNIRDYFNTMLADSGKVTRFQQAMAPLVIAHLQKKQRELDANK